MTRTKTVRYIARNDYAAVVDGIEIGFSDTAFGAEIIANDYVSAQIELAARTADGFDFSGSLNEIADSALAAMRELAPADAEAYAAQWLDALVDKGISVNDRRWSAAEVEQSALFYLVGRQGADNAFTDDVLNQQRETIIHWGDKSCRLTDRQRAAIIRIVVSDLGSGVMPAASHYAAAETFVLRGADPVVDAAQERAQSAAQQGPMRGTIVVHGKLQRASRLLGGPYYGKKQKQAGAKYQEMVISVEGWTRQAVDDLIEKVDGGLVGWGMESHDGIEGCWIVDESNEA